MGNVAKPRAREAKRKETRKHEWKPEPQGFRNWGKTNVYGGKNQRENERGGVE